MKKICLLYVGEIFPLDPTCFSITQKLSPNSEIREPRDRIQCISTCTFLHSSMFVKFLGIL